MGISVRVSSCPGTWYVFLVVQGFCVLQRVLNIFFLKVLHISYLVSSLVFCFMCAILNGIFFSWNRFPNWWRFIYEEAMDISKLIHVLLTFWVVLWCMIVFQLIWGGGQFLIYYNQFVFNGPSFIYPFSIFILL